MSSVSTSNVLDDQEIVVQTLKKDRTPIPRMAAVPTPAGAEDVNDEVKYREKQLRGHNGWTLHGHNNNDFLNDCNDTQPPNNPPGPDDSDNDSDNDNNPGAPSSPGGPGDDGSNNGDGPGGPGGPGGSNDRESIDGLKGVLAGMSTKKTEPGKTIVKNPDAFNGSEPRKLKNFLVSLSLVFLDYPEYFTEQQKINYTISYLSGMAREWFEPDILNPDITAMPMWTHSFQALVKELQDNFGLYDAQGNSEDKLGN
ncbi:hypothetical protein GGU11DRAFT_749820 [Lentinula aff. detonsa]|nr:hypothetical protein GGU11DRAFT_749820 [Lentinula aff. detonsa]